MGHTLEPSALFDELGLRLLVHLAPDGYHPVLHPDAKPARVDPEMVEQVALDLIVDLGIGSLGALFATWRRPLPHARAWLDGRPWRGPLGRLPLRDGAEVVVQEGLPLAPVHASYTFPP